MTTRFNIVGLPDAPSEALMRPNSGPIEASWSRAFAMGKMLRSVIVLSLVLFVGAALPAALQVVLWSLCLLALASPKYALLALVMAAAMRYLNPAVFVLGIDANLSSWVLLLSATLRALMSFQPSALTLLLPLWCFSLVVAALTVMTSAFVSVSLMKLISFAVGATTVILCCCALTRAQRAELMHWLAAMAVTLVIFSAATFLMPAVAHHRGAGFQGIVNHPQSLGALLAPFLTWLLASVYLQRKSLWSFAIPAALVLVGMILASETRTAMVAVMLALMVSFLHLVFARGRYHNKHTLWRHVLKITVTIVVALVLIISVQPARDAVFGYVFKRESSNVEEALSSRAGGIASQWEFFSRKPVQGWGFGIYPGHNFAKDVHYFMGIPISAPVEKGFLPTAVLEEVGLVGAGLLLLLLIAMVRAAARQADIRWLAVLYTCIFINLGEMVFFSTGGLGMIFWVLMGLATTKHD